MSCLKYYCLPVAQASLKLLPPPYPALPSRKVNYNFLPDKLTSRNLSDFLGEDKSIGSPKVSSQEFFLNYDEKVGRVGSVSKKWLTKIVKFFKVKSTK